jgi:hypothetical protein
MISKTKQQGRTIVEKAGLYALGFLILLGVLIIGAGFALLDAVKGPSAAGGAAGRLTPRRG